MESKYWVLIALSVYVTQWVVRAWWMAGEPKRLDRIRKTGYEYAAGRLLLDGDAVIDVLESEAASDLFKSAFDDGIIHALRDWQHRTDGIQGIIKAAAYGSMHQGEPVQMIAAPLATPSWSGAVAAIHHMDGILQIAGALVVPDEFRKGDTVWVLLSKKEPQYEPKATDGKPADSTHPASPD